MRYRVGVVVPVLLAFEDAIKTLECVRTKHIWTPYIAPQWKKNLSISKVWNMYGSEAFDDGCDFVLMLNDDAFLFPWSLDEMIDESCKDEGILISGEDSLKPFDGYRPEASQKTNPNFSAFVIQPNFFEAAGLFDENFYPAYFEDNDMHYRIIQLGLSAYGISGAQFYHKASVTQKERIKRNSSQAHNQFAACQAYYVKKWGGRPQEERFKTPYNNGGSVKEWILQK